jgi:hypothetical protein
VRVAATLLLIALFGCAEDGPRISTSERVRLLTMRSVWVAEARAERCPRPALRTPVTGDGSALLLGMRDRSSPDGQCLSRVRDLYDELEPCYPNADCTLPKLEALKPHPEVLVACAPLYDKIARLAHANAACSPISLDLDVTGNNEAWFLALDHAVRIQVAPLVAKGEIGAAARHVIDAMRFADDYGRKAVTVGPMMTVAMTTRLAGTLDELLVDRRLSTDEARAVAHDLDVLLASGLPFDAIMRQEDAWVAKNLDELSPDKDVVPMLLEIEQRARGVRRMCSATLRECAEHVGEVKLEGDLGSSSLLQIQARSLGSRDLALTFVRMQAELRTASPEDCNDPTARRRVLAKWLTPDQAILGDEREPIVSAPAWQRTDPPKRASRPWALRCIPATL